MLHLESSFVYHNVVLKPLTYRPTPRYNVYVHYSKGTMAMPHTLTKPVTSRINPVAVAALRDYAEQDEVTRSAFIAKLVYTEIQRRKESAR